MKKIVIFIITILVLGVLAMTTCVQNSKRIEQEKSKGQIATTIDEITNTDVNNKAESNIIESKEEKNESIVIEDKIVEQDKTETSKQNNTEVVKKTEVDTKTIQNTNKANNKKKVEQPEISEQTDTKKETQTNSSYTEVKVNVAEKKECDGNNHKIGAGNTGLWFKTKDEAIATYKAEIKKWGDKWTNNEISDDEYYKNCPYGYEVWSCPYCNMWTLNYYLDK